VDEPAWPLLAPAPPHLTHDVGDLQGFALPPMWYDNPEKGEPMPKRSFRPHTTPGNASAAYPSWLDLASRREFLTALGAAAAVGIVGCASDADRAAPGHLDSGPPVADQGIAPDITSAPKDMAPPPDHPGWPDLWPDKTPPWVGDLPHDVALVPDLPLPAIDASW